MAKSSPLSLKDRKFLALLKLLNPKDRMKVLVNVAKKRGKMQDKPSR